MLMSKMKKYYFDTFPNEKHFEKQFLPYSQTPPKYINQVKDMLSISGLNDLIWDFYFLLPNSV